MSGIAVLGAGSWGTVLADLLARQGRDVLLWAYEPEVAEEIRRDRTNSMYFAGKRLTPSLQATADSREAVKGRDVVLCVCPSQVLRGVLAPLANAVSRDALLVGATKGIEAGTLRTMSAVAAETLPGRDYVALSGPSFAEEVFAGQPTAVVAASRNPEAARRAQELLSTGTFRVYTAGDVLGTELAGALKNVIAIAAGMCEGLGLGNNPRAALITRGLAEISRLGVAMGADPRTFAGLAGVGDLVLTTCGALSRNRSLGVALAQGQDLGEYTRSRKGVVEGVYAARAALELAGRAGVEMPLTAMVRQCLFESKPPRDAITELMNRPLKPEQWT